MVDLVTLIYHLVFYQSYSYHKHLHIQVGYHQYLIDDIDDRIMRLKRECPAEWSPNKIELDSKISRIANIYEEVWPNVSDADVGGAF